MQTPDRITLVLRAPAGQPLESVTQYAQIGAHVSIGRGLAVIASVSATDLLVELGQEREDRQTLAEQCDLALGAPRHLVAHALEMFDLLNRVNVKCGGLDAVLAHGNEPSEQMWRESREAMESIWDLLDKIQSGAPAVDADRVNQIAREGENVNRTTEESSAVATHAHIDDLVKEAAAEPVFMTVVFKLPNAQAAGALVQQLPFREKVLGTEAEVFGLTTGNAMEDAQ